MDRVMELRHLAEAERHVPIGERHIAEQEHRIAELDRDGHDTQRARALLKLFRQTQTLHVAHRGLILQKFEEDARKPRIIGEPMYRPGHYPM